MPQIGCAFMLARILSVWFSIGNRPLCPVPKSSRKCAVSEGICSRQKSSIARVVRMPRFRSLKCTLALSQESDVWESQESSHPFHSCSLIFCLCSRLVLHFSRLSLLSALLFFFSVISSLFPLLSLPLTAQIALAMYLLLHEWGRELPFLTITLSTSFTSKIMLLPATA